MTQASASDRKSIRAQEKKAAQIDVARGDFVRVMMATVEGRLYVYEFLTTCNVFHSTYSPVAMQMAFAEGQRNIGLQLLNDVMRFIPDQYLPMMREANVRHDSNRSSPSSRPAEGSSAGELSGSQNDGRDVEGSDYADGRDYDPYGTEAN